MLSFEWSHTLGFYLQNRLAMYKKHSHMVEAWNSFYFGNSIFAARENRELDILIFKEVLENIARVDRTLTKPGGSLLMAGRSGVGRRTAVALVAHMHNIQLFTPKVSRGYGIKQFRTDLKSVSAMHA